MLHSRTFPASVALHASDIPMTLSGNLRLPVGPDHRYPSRASESYGKKCATASGEDGFKRSGQVFVRQ